MHPMTADMTDAIRSRAPMGLLANIDHPSGMVHIWTGLGRLPYNGVEYIGLGVLAGIEPITQTVELSIQEVRLTLNTLQNNPDIAQDFISESIKGYEADIYLAAFNNDYSVVRDPIQISNIRLDYQTLSIGNDGNINLSLTGQLGFYKLQRSIDKSYTAEEVKKKYPDDTGLDMISQMETKETTWTP